MTFLLLFHPSSNALNVYQRYLPALVVLRPNQQVSFPAGYRSQCRPVYVPSPKGTRQLTQPTSIIPHRPLYRHVHTSMYLTATHSTAKAQTYLPRPGGPSRHPTIPRPSAGPTRVPDAGLSPGVGVNSVITTAKPHFLSNSQTRMRDISQALSVPKTDREMDSTS